MHRVRNLLLLPGLVLSGCLLLLLRYILKTPQPLTSILPGDDHIYKWTHGHIFFKVHGNADAPPLLLLHAPGIGASAHEMLPMMEQLAQHYRIYAPDLLGFGLSDAPNVDYNANLFVALCRDFLHDVVQQPATLLARGLSCNYALAVASRSPELCTRLVLLPYGPVKTSSYTGDTGLSNHTITVMEHGLVEPHGLVNRALTYWYTWLSRMISRSTLFATFVYSLLTPHIILRQVIGRQLDGGIASRRDLNYSFAAAHQLGAQYAALAFVTGKLNLDIRLEIPSQPTLLLWNYPPRIDSVTRHYMSLPQLQTIFLNDARYCIHESAPQNVATAILHWQDTAHKETSVAVGAKTVTKDSATLTPSRSLPIVSPAETRSPTAEQVENSQPLNLKAETENTTSSAPVTVEAFCMKCKQKRTMYNAHRIVTKNGRNAMEGTCPICNTKLFLFVSR